MRAPSHPQQAEAEGARWAGEVGGVRGALEGALAAARADADAAARELITVGLMV